MILPNKYIKLEYSLLGASARIIEQLSKPKTMSQLWYEVREDPIINTYQRFVICLDFLFTIGVLNIINGKLTKRTGE